MAYFRKTTLLVICYRLWRLLFAHDGLCCSGEVDSLCATTGCLWVHEEGPLQGSLRKQAQLPALVNSASVELVHHVCFARSGRAAMLSVGGHALILWPRWGRNLRRVCRQCLRKGWHNLWSWSLATDSRVGRLAFLAESEQHRSIINCGCDIFEEK